LKQAVYFFEKYLSLLVVILAIATVSVCFFFPVYTDEIAWKVILGRYWADGNKALAQSLIPSCGPYAYSVPLILLPFRIFYQWINHFLTTPLSIRLFGISTALVTLFIIWKLFSDVTHNSIKNKTIALCIIAFATLGVMPFMLIISRPEQILLLCITIFFIPLLNNTKKNDSLFRTGRNAMSLLILAGIMLTAHPKAIFALPLVLLSFYRLITLRILSFICIFVIVIFSAIQFNDWSTRWSCDSNPIMAAYLRYVNLSEVKNITEFKVYFFALLKSLTHAKGWYIYFIVPKMWYVSNMIPPYTTQLALQFGNLLFYLLTGVVIISFSVFVFNFIKNRKDNSYLISYLAIASLWFFYLASLITRIDKNDYESALILPLLAFAVSGTLYILERTLKSNKQFYYYTMRMSFYGLLIFSIISQFILIITYTPYIFVMEDWKRPGYPRTQHFSVSNFGYNQLRSKITEAAEKCGIRASNHPHHLVVDELTYFNFRDSYQPFFMTYLDENGWGRNQLDLTTLLIHYRSAGIIVGCQWIPTALRNQAIHDGKFCCLPAFKKKTT